ncbi:MFS transporter [Pseudomonas sp. NA-150]|uniref:MFS transporter n=1 Tax=Pseudomonas sp. NA-150 TaxID=3367525 RepID=UPI0037C7D99C
MSQPLQNPSPTGRRRGSLGFLAITMLCFFAASSAPTPLYHLYQQRWGFSSTMLTLIFAVYALSLLLSLLVVGRLSDYLGRRPVIFAALLLEVLSMVLFIGAADANWLIFARVLQGFATGMATSALGAALLDCDQVKGPLVNSVAPMVGMALGALGTSVLVEFAPLPLLLAYIVMFVAFVLQAVYVWRLPESVSPQAGAWASLKPSISVPPQARRTLLLILPVDVAAWALGGFYLSLTPSLLAAATGSTSVLNGGLAVAALTLSGVAAILYVRTRAASVALLVGASFLSVGVAVMLAGINAGWLWLFFVGTVIAGCGFGSSFTGSLRLLLPLAHAHERAGLMASFLVLSYLAFCVPALVAGAAVHSSGLIATTNVYGGVVIVLALLALLGLLIQRAGAARRALQQG